MGPKARLEALRECRATPPATAIKIVAQCHLRLGWTGSCEMLYEPVVRRKECGRTQLLPSRSGCIPAPQNQHGRGWPVRQSSAAVRHQKRSRANLKREGHLSRSAQDDLTGDGIVMCLPDFEAVWQPSCCGRLRLRRWPVRVVHKAEGSRQVCPARRPW